MSFSIKLDENLSIAHVNFLHQAGYDADRIDEQGLSGATDECVWERVCADKRLFVTLDLDFSDIRKYRPGTHPGILLIRPRSRSAKAVMDVLARVAAEISLADLAGCLAVANLSFTRIRRPPRSTR